MLYEPYVHISIYSVCSRDNNICAEIGSSAKAVQEIAVFSTDGCLAIKRFVQLEEGYNLIKIPMSGLQKGIHQLTLFLQDTTRSMNFLA